MGPLAGMRIIEFGGIGPAPFCGMLFADMGADVIVIDRKRVATNTFAPSQAAKFVLANRGKKSIALDLKQAATTELVLRLLENADGLIEGFRPGVMERLGLGPDICLAANPKLVYGRMTGWGQYGPLSQSAGHDLNYIALSGALYYGGRANSPPSSPPTLVGDVGGGALMLLAGMLAALINVQKSAQGQVVDAAITDGAALATTLLYGLHQEGRWQSRRQANLLDGGSHWYDCYECADGKFISLAALEPGFYALLLQKLGLDEDPDFAEQFDAARWPRLKQRFVEIFKGRTRHEWCDLLEGTDVCFAPVLDFDEAPQHAHNRARQTFTSLAGVTQPAPAPRFSETATKISSPPPEPGEQTDEVLRMTGLTGDEIAALRAGHVI